MRFLAGVLACGVLVCTTPAHAQTAPALLVVAEATLLLDLSTTLDVKNHAAPWQLNASESNPLLGRHPSDVKLLAYFAVVMGGTALGYRLLPEDYRPLAMAGVIVLEAYCVHRNLKNGMSFTLLF